NLDLALRHDGPEHALAGEGRFTVSRLRWHRSELAGEIQGEVRLSGQELRLRDFTGNLGRGILHGQVAYHFNQPERSWFSLGLDGVEARRLLAPWPELAARI